MNARTVMFSTALLAAAAVGGLKVSGICPCPLETALAAPPPDAVALGGVVPDFSLPAPGSGDAVSFAALRKGADGATVPVVVSFWSYKCPSGKSSMKRYAALAEAAAKKGARFVGVCSYGESAGDIAKYAKDNGIGYTLGVDADTKVADIFGAQAVTATYVVDKDGKLVYRGSLGDEDAPWPEKALDEAMAGKPVSKAETRPTG